MEGEEGQMEGERVGTKRCRRKASRRMERQRAEPRMGVGWAGEEKIEALEAGSLPRARRLPRASLLRFPQCKGNPGKPLWAPFVCSRPGSDDAVDLFVFFFFSLIWFLNSGFAAFWAGAGVC